MSDCRECDKNCSIRGRFDIVLEVAKEELDELRKRQSLMNPEDFWIDVDFFYHKYPICIIFALDAMIMDSYFESERSQDK